ncbi:phage major tail protein, TP901-1 family [Marinicauda pacifica]|uniref:Phage major tail protein, TP901-1 family n=1 Tax=Marinicauda pacifica TaxID=1133559 RepID=A0A4S2H7V6_9PROT|nr:phage major tail protein, TP901-1 family [Marinicauda pacifica]TGY91743.1 phage major tail protein, TP901-1 family [Marinicauda pacifica]GGE51109.1 phage major tail protein, TP901-1 family [Marinicauda pacifica]
MAAQAGKDILLKIGDGADPESFTSVAGLRARTISLNARSVETTHADSPGRWRELLGGAGVRSASVSGAGIFVDSAADETVRAVFFTQAKRRWQLVIPDFGALTGDFLVTALEYSGRHDGEAAYSLSLASAGEIGFAAN